MYQRQWATTVVAGGEKRVYSDPIKPGWILYVTCCYVWAPDRTPWNETFILVEVGGQDLVVRVRAEDAKQCGVSTYRPFYVGEHQRIIGWTPDAVVGHRLSLNVFGELTPLKKWRRGKV